MADLCTQYDQNSAFKNLLNDAAAAAAGSHIDEHVQAGKQAHADRC